MYVTILGKPHEAAVASFSLALAYAASAANIPDIYTPLAGTRIEGTVSKEPDGSWIPDSLPPTRDNTWPTIVLEVGVSQSKKKLRRDAAWWLANSQGLVKLVITASINRTAPEITFESIVLEQPISTARHSRRQYKPITRQSIVISRPPGGPNQPITCIPNSPLLISCEELLCHPPNPPETDIDIPVASLKRLALRVWRFQGL